MLFLLTQLADAAVPEDLETVKQHIAEKEYDQAMDLLEELDKETKDLDYLITAQQLAEIYYYSGVVKYFKDGQGLDEWRSALILRPSLGWNDQLVNDSLAWDIFLAIQGEIPHRPKIELLVPEPFGRAKVYVDGVQRTRGDTVPAGRHLLQIECPEGEVISQWTDFERAIKWTKLCPYKFDLNDIPEEEVADEWDMFGPSFGVSSAESAEELKETAPSEQQAGSDVGSTAPDVEPSGSEKSASSASADVAEQTGEAEVVPLWLRMGGENKTTTLSCAGLAAASLVIYSSALSGKAKYQDENNQEILDAQNPEEALDLLRKQTNNKVYVSAAMGAAAAALYAKVIWNIQLENKELYQQQSSKPVSKEPAAESDAESSEAAQKNEGLTEPAKKAPKSLPEATVEEAAKESTSEEE